MDMLLANYYSYEGFLSDVQHLELVRKLILKKDIFSHKIAVILADNLVEIFMFRMMNVWVEHESEIAAMLKPQINQEKIYEINRYYNEKIKWLKRGGHIDSLDAEKIKFVHFYRNLSYHNEAEILAMEAIALLGLHNALTMFRKFYSDSCTESISEGESLSNLSIDTLPTDRIEYNNASEVISKKISKGLINNSKITNILKKKLKERIGLISDKRNELSWLKKDIVFNEWLKVAEFFDRNPYVSFSKRVFEINYEIIKLKNGDRPKSSKLRRRKKIREAARDKKISKMLAKFKPFVSSYSLKSATNLIASNANDLEVFLPRYIETDKKLMAMSFLLQTIEKEFDREVQQEIDIKRGK